MACTVDFRCLDEGFGGKTYKRKRAEIEKGNGVEDGGAMEVEEIPRKRQGVPSEEDPNKPVVGRPTYDGVRVPGKNWKQRRKHRSHRQRR